jgi:outer membrane protein
VRILVVLSLVLASAPALAQGEAFGVFGDYAATPDEIAGARDGEPRLRLALGAGIAAMPRFPGSDGYRLRPVPVLFAGYGRFFFGAGGVGAHLYRDSRWRLSAMLSAGGGRKESNDPHLSGLGDVDRAVRAGFVAAYRAGNLVTRASVATDVSGEGQGTLAKLDLYSRFRAAERLTVFAGPGVSWSNRQYTQTFFGVSHEQSARSGLPEFEASSGANSVRLSAGAIYRVDEHWGLAASTSAARLVGDAGRSPITETRSQYFFLVAAIYRVR